LPSTSSSTSAEGGRPRRGRLVLLAAIVVAAVGAVTGWAVASGSSPRSTSSSPSRHASPSGGTATTAAGAPTVGPAAPGFSLTTLTGGHVSLAALAGHPVLVNFWASWCYPCRQEFPLLRAALARHRAQGLVIVGVSFQDIPDDARAFVREQHADWIFARDDDGAVAAAYGVRPVPETFFVRRDGTLARRLFGITSARELEQDLNGILPPA
jgi:cytochrome c biogenesis protein CcmG, thiol:disulfide interchange protein DsbE